MASRTGENDPELPFKIAPMDGRYARESGLRLKESVTPGPFENQAGLNEDPLHLSRLEVRNSPFASSRSFLVTSSG
jgi:hypothetical protein